MQQLRCYSNIIILLHLHVEKIEQTAADEKLRGELGARMGSVGTTPLTNSRTERNRAQHGQHFQLLRAESLIIIQIFFK